MNRTPGNTLSAFTFPKSKSSLWDPSPAGDVVGLHLCYYRNPRLRVLEKALRMAHRHAHQGNHPTFCCFLLGSISVDEDEGGVTLTLDRFDPGRAQPGTQVPRLLVPGDVVVPVELVLHRDSHPNPTDLSITFKALQQACTGGEVVDLSQLLGVRVQVSCSQQGDQLSFSLRWLAASCASGFEVVGVRPLPIIPTALARSLSGRGPPSHGLKHQRGFLTMDQTRKLLLLLESDPKACSVPLVGVWLSGVVQPSNPQVWAWCLRFFHSSFLHNRVLSEHGCFLLVVFSPGLSQAQFYQCRCAGQQSGHMEYLLLRCSQNITLFKHVEPAEGHYLQCELSVDETRGPTANPSSSLLVALVDQDSGVEDEDLSPRPSPNPHAPTQQTRRVQPSVPELSLLLDVSLPPSELPPTPQPCTSSRSSCSPQPEPSLMGRRYLHSTPSAPLSQSRGGFWTGQTPPTLILPQSGPERTSTPPRPSGHPCSPHDGPGAFRTSRSPPRSHRRPDPPLWGEGGGGDLPSDAYQILMAQERQLRLLQAQIQMLLETQVRPQVDSHTSCRQTDCHLSSPTTPRPTTASVAVETGASLFWRSTLSPPTTLGRDIREDQPSSSLNISTQELRGASGVESPVLGESASMFFNTSATQPDHQDVLPTLQLQVSSRLQASLSDQETPAQPSSSSSSSYDDHTRSYRKQEVHARSYRKQDMSEGDEEQLGPQSNPSTRQEASTLACINPALLPSLAQTPRDPLSLTQTPRDPLLPGDLSLAQTPREPLQPGRSVDLSLEANAIALRYLSDSQLSRQSSKAALWSPERNVLSHSNMSLATRGYMRRYGLIEEEEEEEEGLPCTTLSTESSLPQSQLISDLQPKLRLLALSSRNPDKENQPIEQRSSLAAGSVGNFLDVSRLRQLPKLF